MEKHVGRLKSIFVGVVLSSHISQVKNKRSALSMGSRQMGHRSFLATRSLAHSKQQHWCAESPCTKTLSLGPSMHTTQLSWSIANDSPLVALAAAAVVAATAVAVASPIPAGGSGGGDDAAAPQPCNLLEAPAPNPSPGPTPALVPAPVPAPASFAQGSQAPPPCPGAWWSLLAPEGSHTLARDSAATTENASRNVSSPVLI